MKALPSIARAVSSSPDAYVYLAESIRAWPDQAGLAARIQAAGWGDPEWRNLTGGIVALHRATARAESVGVDGQSLTLWGEARPTTQVSPVDRGNLHPVPK